MFGPLPGVLQTSSTLARLSKLDLALKATFAVEVRAQMVDSIRDKWVELRNRNFEDSSEARQATLDLIAKLRRQHGVRISACFSVEEGVEIDTWRENIDRSIRDLGSVLVPPASKSQRGNKGPTIIVNYRRPSLFLAPYYTQAYVLKWTDLNEIFMTKIYDQFSRSLIGPTSAGFIVPANVGLDLERGIHFQPNRDPSSIDAETSEILNTNFDCVRAEYSPNTHPQIRVLMISSKVRGANLFDFAKTKYHLLTHAQKVKFMTRLGRIAMLDLFCGNIDRLVQIIYSNDCYQLEAMEVNLGNVMVESLEGDEDQIPYAIDNGIEHDLISDPVKRKKYIVFLKELLSDRDSAIVLLTRNILDSFHHALTAQADESITENENREDIVRQLEPFSTDLRNFGPESISIGLTQMYRMLDSSLLTIWKGEPSRNLRKQIALHAPELLTAIDEIFKRKQSRRRL